jgi:biopolymer transport protein ExbB
LTFITAAAAQDDAPKADPAGPSAPNELERMADAEAEQAAKTEAELRQGSDEAEAVQPSLNPLSLLLSGGWLMIPIGLMSIVVVLLGIERSLALRRAKVLPEELVEAFGRLAAGDGGFDPRRAYRVCQQHPSSAANVVRVMLLKVGRPHAEVEHAVAEANEREASRLYSNVRTLNLAAAVTPLIGLLGTVAGMIQAFFATANLMAGQNKADALASGIYQALVTTFAGLAVAIPAAVLAHFFEGRIQALFREIDELLFNMLPQVERFEGKMRVGADQLSSDAAAPPVEATARGN